MLLPPPRKSAETSTLALSGVEVGVVFAVEEVDAAEETEEAGVKDGFAVVGIVLFVASMEPKDCTCRDSDLATGRAGDGEDDGAAALSFTAPLTMSKSIVGFTTTKCWRRRARRWRNTQRTRVGRRGTTHLLPALAVAFLSCDDRLECICTGDRERGEGAADEGAGVGAAAGRALGPSRLWRE